MVGVPLQPLKKQLKQAEKEWHAATRNELWRAFWLGIKMVFLPTQGNELSQLHEDSQKKLLSKWKKAYHLKQLLETRQKAITSYQTYKSGHLSRSDAVTNVLEYQAAKYISSGKSRDFNSWLTVISAQKARERE